MNSYIAYTFELTQQHYERSVSRTVQLESAHTLHDLHLIILKAFGLKCDADGFPYADFPYAFYMNNDPDDLNSAFVSDNFEDENKLMEQGMAGFFSAMTGLDLTSQLTATPTVAEPESLHNPAGHTANCHLRNLNLPAKHEFVYDLGVGPEVIVSIKFLGSKLLSNDTATSPPRIVKQRSGNLLK